MNTLSWLIYAAEVTDSIGKSLSGFAGITGVAGAIATVGWFVMKADTPPIYSWDKDPAEKLARHVAMTTTLGKASKSLTIACGCCWLVSSIMPSSGTVYAIAASEMGEQVVKSATFDKATRALNAWLDKQIGQEAKK